MRREIAIALAIVAAAVGIVVGDDETGIRAWQKTRSDLANAQARVAELEARIESREARQRRCAATLWHSSARFAKTSGLRDRAKPWCEASAEPPEILDESASDRDSQRSPGAQPGLFMKPVARTSIAMEIRGPRTRGRRRRTRQYVEAAGGRRSRRSVASGVRSRALMNSPG